MQIFTNVDSTAFTLNGTRYVKNFIVMKVGNTNIQVLNAYDSSLQILSSTHYNQVQVDGNTYGSQALLMNALANVCFSKGAGGGSAIIQNNVGLFNTTLQYVFTTPSNTLLPSEIVTKINLTYAYAVSEIQTPYFFQFVRPALQEGSSTPIQKKYVFMFTGGKGIYGLNQTPVASTQFKLIVESVLNPSDIIDDDTAVINYLGEIEDGDYISVANESEWDFFDTDYTYYFSYVTDGVLYYVVFVGEAGLYGGDNQLFVSDDFIDSTNSDALPYIPTLQEVITQDSTATTSNNISINTTGTGKLRYNGSEVLTNAKIGVANGIVPTDGANKIPVSYLPNAVMIYKGVWNLSTNTPALSNGTGTAGWVYKVTGAPTPTNFNFGAGNIQLTNGDYVIYSDTATWEKSDGSDAVTSVNGYQGVVSLGYADVGAAAASHTHSISDVTGLTTALDGKANVDGGNAGGTWGINITGNAAAADYWKPTLVTDFNTPTGYKLLQANTESPTNGLGTNEFGQGIQFSSNNNPAYLNQLVFDLSGNLHTRSKIAGSWYDWNKLPIDSNVLHKTGNETKTGNLTMNDNILRFGKAAGGVQWEETITQGNNLTFTNLFNSETPVLTLGQSGDVNIPNGSIQGKFRKFKSESITIPSGANRWVKLFTTSTDNNLSATVEGNLLSSNSVNGFTIDIRGGYYDSNFDYGKPFIEVTNGTYNERLKEVMVLKESNRLAIYILIRANDEDVALFWNLDTIDTGDVEVNNSLTTPIDASGSFILPTTPFVKANNFGYTQLRAGYVGVGTTTPATRLSVSDKTNSDLITGSIGSLGVHAFTLGGYNTDASHAGFVLKTNNAGTMTEAMRVLSNGNVGIGNTNPTDKLHVEGNFRALGVGHFGTATVNDLTTRIVIHNDHATGKQWALSSGIPSVSQSTFGIMNLTDGGVTPISITAGGNVGIGNYGGAEKLHVSGNLLVGDVLPMLLYNNPSEATRVNGLFYNTDNSGYRFGIGKIVSGVKTDQITLLDNGKVGIGMTPEYKFDVNGSTRTDGVLVVTQTGNFGGEVTIPNGTASTSAVNLSQLNTKPNLDGSGAYGTWNINIAGNAAGTATNASNWLPIPVDDFNVTTGFKLLQGNNSAINGIGTGVWNQGIQFSTNNNPDYANQLVYDVVGGMYTRTKYAGSWGGWAKIATATDLSLKANADGSNAYSTWSIDITGGAGYAEDSVRLGGYQYNDTESIDIDNFIVNYAGEMHPMSVTNAQIKLGVDAIRANLTVSIPATSANSYSSASGINVPGAQVGDFVQIVTNLSYNGGIIYHGHVTSANTVTIHRFNGSSSGLSSGSIDMKIKLTR